MNENTLPSPVPASVRRRPLGLPILALVALAALGLPRVILHDLHIIDGAGVLPAILAIGPVVVWIVVAVARRVPNPFLTVLVIGVIFGAMLVITHQLLWDVAFEGRLPTLGLGPASVVVPRIAAIVSGTFTGALIGAVGGLVAWGVQALLRRREPRA